MATTNKPRIALIARMCKSGLGAQTRRLARLIKPDKVVIIDSSSFNLAKQYPEWYKDYNVITIDGFPTDQQVQSYVADVDVLISCELFYNASTTQICNSNAVETILIVNPEFFDWLTPRYYNTPLPSKVVVPSHWRIAEMHKRFNATYLPTPIFSDEFENARAINLKRTDKRKYLFVNGKTAIHDRNGLESLYRALEHSTGDYTVTIKAQQDIKKHPDPRIVYDFTNPEDNEKLYTDYDALILPRRYAGQSLPMCEALSSGLPVIMTDIDPNNMALPKDWLVPATPIGSFMTRTEVTIFEANHEQLAQKLDIIDVGYAAKLRAIYLSQEYDAETLRKDYHELVTVW